MSEINKPFDIPSHWEWSTFADVGSWVGGGTPSKRNSSYWQGTIPWVSPKDMKQAEIRDTQDHVTKDAINASATKMVDRKSVV